MMLRSRYRVLVPVILMLSMAACGGASSRHATRPASASVAAPAATTAAATATSAPSTAAAKPSGTTTTETLDVNGVSRKAIVYVPASRSAGRPTAAVVVLHGAGGSGIEIEYDSNMNVEADRLGFIAVYPDGTPNYAVPFNQRSWNSGRVGWGADQPPDDVGFMAKLFDLLVAKYTVDPNRIAAAGFSSGGFMAARLACELSIRVAAIAVIAGPRDDSACVLKRPLSVLVVHGTADMLEPYAGGPTGDASALPDPAEADVVGFWRTHDSCTAQPATSMVSGNVQLQTYGSCQGGSEVRFYTVQNGTHCWPGAGSGPACEQSVTWNATPAIADFLLAHPILGGSAP